jgi:hypothetical protein
MQTIEACNGVCFEYDFKGKIAGLGMGIEKCDRKKK